MQPCTATTNDLLAYTYASVEIYHMRATETWYKLCVCAYIGTNHPFAIIWCRNRAWNVFWDGIVLLILLQMSQCGLLDKRHVVPIILLKNNNNTKDRLKENSHQKENKCG